MQNVNEQKIRLEQRENRLALDKTKFKLKERKMRTRQLIEIGGLIVKAELDSLPTNTLYGALLFLQDTLAKQSDIKDEWTKVGQATFDKEQQQKTAVILKLNDKPSQEIRDSIRSHSLKWNYLRQEWYGYCANLEALKASLVDLKYDLQIIT